jgi:Fic family protein
MTADALSTRAGNYISQAGGYKAFIPRPLPPDPPIVIDDKLQVLLSKADRALGRLDGTASVLPNPDLFLAMYVRKEAVLSSQIEGTQASLIDVLDYEATGEMIKDVDEIVNCVRAMNKGLERLKELPLSLRLIKEIHEELLQGVRCEHRSPGEFRRTQNWVGPQGSTIQDALFIPPPPQEVLRLMGDLETFMHKKTQLPYLIKNALIHAQFETIHPFLDGNGRIGRLLITFLLVHDEILQKPLLYLSYHFKKNRTEYYDRLSNIRSNGDWEGWITFFLKGVFEVSQQATETGMKIIQLLELDRGKLSNNTNGLKLLDYLFVHPYVTIHDICKVTGVSPSTAGRLVKELINYGILLETTGYSRNRKFIYDDYYNLLKQGIEST